jgi:hypothetical protein
MELEVLANQHCELRLYGLVSMLQWLALERRHGAQTPPPLTPPLDLTLLTRLFSRGGGVVSAAANAVGLGEKAIFSLHESKLERPK